MAYPLQIVHMIVGRVKILMMHFLALSWGTHKCTCYQSMDKFLDTMIVLAQVYYLMAARNAPGS